MAGDTVTRSTRPVTFPLTGSKCSRLSISSPKNATRTPPRLYDGNTSTVSPLTRNVPGVHAMSFRSYWIATSRSSNASRPISSPTLSPINISR